MSAEKIGIEKELFYQLAHHQLMLATSGRVVYPSLRRADYIYTSKEKKLILTCYRSPKFIRKTYQNPDSIDYMYAPDPVTDVYDSAVDSCFVQTLHLIFLRHGAGFFYSVASVVQALLDTTQTLQTEERERLYQRLLDEHESIQLIPPSNFRGEGYEDLVQGRLKGFREILFSEIRRRINQARREAKK